uniref:Uncharacterized protein n=1 Tax=Zea mays TaxID=4577 RepID=C4JC36_MAIZE|nr:unknown [Zea mays]
MHDAARTQPHMDHVSQSRSSCTLAPIHCTCTHTDRNTELHTHTDRKNVDDADADAAMRSSKQGPDRSGEWKRSHWIDRCRRMHAHEGGSGRPAPQSTQPTWVHEGFVWQWQHWQASEGINRLD